MHRGFIMAIMNHGLHQAKLGAVAASQPLAMSTGTFSHRISHPISRTERSTVSGTAFSTIFSTTSSTVSRPTRHNRASSSQNVKQTIGSNRAKLPLGFALTLDSDSGVLGDHKTSFANVDLLGLTVPRAKVTLAGLQTTADAKGRFLFTNLPLPLGQTRLTATAQTGAIRNQFTSQIERVETDQADAVVTWNAVTLRILRRDQAASLEASRTLAITHSAIYNAVKAVISQSDSSPHNLTENQTNESIAVAAAAHRVLTQLYPDQMLQLDSALANSLGGSSTSTASFLLGQTAADQMLAQRSQDGSERSLTDQPQTKPGKWRPTPPRFLPAAGVAWSQVTPFVLQQADQFRPGPPPRLSSQIYAKELNQVQHLGQIDSRDRSSKQTDIARFWIGSAETGTFVGIWNQIAAELTVQQTQQTAQQTVNEQSSIGVSNLLLQTAGRFAQLNLALADAGIAAWDAKYAYRSWRPITAIRLAGSDHNPATKADPTWQSYLETPAHPDYVSGHSTFSGAAAAILTQSFGSQPFSVTSLDLPGESRRFKSFRQAAAEAGMSRIYGGIHTMSANRAGQQLGRKVANFVLQQFDTVD